MNYGLPCLIFLSALAPATVALAAESRLAVPDPDAQKKADPRTVLVAVEEMGQRMCVAALNYAGPANGIDMIEGRRANANATTFMAALNNNRSYELEIAVRLDAGQAAITMTLDGRPILFYRGAAAALSLHDDWKLPKRSLALAVESGAIFESIRLRPVSGNVKVLP